MALKPFSQLPLSDISTLIDFTTKWKKGFRVHPHPNLKGPFSIHLKLVGNKEIHLADLQLHPASLNKTAIELIFSHWQSYQAYYSPLHSEALLFYA